MMNGPLSSVDATRSMLHSVWQAVRQMNEADFSLGIPADSNARLLQILGIRTMRLEPAVAGEAPLPVKWRDIASEYGIEPLRKLFSEIPVIPFSEWSDVHQAADIWFGLLADVIRPLGRSDWEFIFYLGDPIKRHFFDVDEILDIMSSFSRCGNVTLAVDEREAWGLWSILFGGKSLPEFGMSDPDAKGRYRSIFQTLEVERFVVYSETQALLIVQGSHFEIIRPPVPAHTHNALERVNYIEGYGVGLKAGISPEGSLAFGLATSGSIAEGQTRPTKPEVLDFLAKWMDSI